MPQSGNADYHMPLFRLPPVFRVLTAASGYLEGSGQLAELREAVAETHDAYCTYLEENEDALLDNPGEVDFCEELLAMLEQFPLDAPEPREEAEVLLGLVTDFETRLRQRDLQDLADQLVNDDQEREAWKRLDKNVPEAELETRYYQKIEARVTDVVRGRRDPDEVAAYLESLYEKTMARREAYENSLGPPEDWSAELALADGLLMDGYEDWLNALEALWGACSEPDPDVILDGLSLLKQGIRKFTLVERLAEGPPRNVTG